MKQHIDTTQLSQLNDKGMERLAKWLDINIDDCRQTINKADTYTEKSIWAQYHLKHIDDNSLLSIGQMIEFLGDNDINVQISDTKNSLISLKDNARWLAHDATIVESLGKLWTDGGTGELVNALWSACVEILNRE